MLLCLALASLRGPGQAVPPAQPGMNPPSSITSATVRPTAAPPSASEAAGARGRGFHPDAPFTTAEAFSKAIGRPAVMLDSPNVSILAPKTLTNAAAIVLPYLARA